MKPPLQALERRLLEMVHAIKAPPQALPGPEEEPMKATLQALEGPGELASC